MPDHNISATQRKKYQEKDFHAIFSSITDGAFIYDELSHIVFMNTAATHILGLAAGTDCLGHSYREYLHLVKDDSGQVPLSDNADDVLLHALHDQESVPAKPHHVFIQQPHGKVVCVDLYCAPTLHSPQQLRHGICLMHLEQKQQKNEKRTQQIIQVLFALMGLFPIGEVEDSDVHLAAELIASSDMKAITQSIVDLLRSHLACDYTWLLTFDMAQDQVRFVAMSGFTREQEAARHQAAATCPLSEFISTAHLARLLTNEILVVQRDELPIHHDLRMNMGPQTMLCIPLFVFDQVLGCLVLAKNGRYVRYSSAEIELVRAMALLISLILRQFHLQTQLSRTQAREQMLSETNQRINEFLDLASHELFTPLTILMGNLQLAQRRFQREPMPESVEQWHLYQANMMQVLDNILQGARIQERMIYDMLDDSRIQTQALTLQLRPCNLQELVKTTVAEQQAGAPERNFQLYLAVADQPPMIMAEPSRIKRVVDTFLRQADAYSPLDRPVSIYLCVQDAVARVEVQDQGWGIPYEEQDLIWQRFYRSTGLSVQHELDLSLGLGLYLCRAFIELHHGSTGLESHPGQGATFWFTIPIIQAQE
ncbi:hypothetical protein KDH_79300 [Dictyobacter sp. S3.2.2.5]|uniref:histidine kinase n=1 Tax=Dictyobacter halimunensis TaxID=3026934 RepID=A0ABQ6G7Q2_9CHLR|nr:hypothetical protein KDH_79300 [Dictyobacter sp. S3.2.2.5]